MHQVSHMLTLCSLKKLQRFALLLLQSRQLLPQLRDSQTSPRHSNKQQHTQCQPWPDGPPRRPILRDLDPLHRFAIFAVGPWQITHRILSSQSRHQNGSCFKIKELGASRYTLKAHSGSGRSG
jgi:hypothetical protein